MEGKKHMENTKQIISNYMHQDATKFFCRILIDGEIRGNLKTHPDYRSLSALKRNDSIEAPKDFQRLLVEAAAQEVKWTQKLTIDEVFSNYYTLRFGKVISGSAEASGITIQSSYYHDFIELSPEAWMLKDDDFLKLTTRLLGKSLGRKLEDTLINGDGGINGENHKGLVVAGSGDDGVYGSGVDLVETVSLSETDLINLIGMTDEHQNAEFYMNEKTFLAEVYPLSKTGTLVSKENGKWFISDKEVNFSSKVQDGIIYLANMDYMGINVFRPSSVKQGENFAVGTRGLGITWFINHAPITGEKAFAKLVITGQE